MTIRSRRVAPPYLFPAVTVLALLAVLAYPQMRFSPMDGTWVRESGFSMIMMPDARIRVMSNEVSIHLTRDQFRLRYWAPSVAPGVAHFTVQLDDREHLYISIPGSEAKVTYRAAMDGSAVVVTKHVFTASTD